MVPHGPRELFRAARHQAGEDEERQYEQNEEDPGRDAERAETFEGAGLVERLLRGFGVEVQEFVLGGTWSVAGRCVFFLHTVLNGIAVHVW